MGSTFDSWNNGGGDSGGTGGSGGASARDPSDSQDFAAVKLDADGTEVWRFHEGSEGNDRLYSGALDKDGSVLLLGVTSTNDGMNGGDTVIDELASFKLDASGRLVWHGQGSADKHDVWGTTSSASLFPLLSSSTAAAREAAAAAAAAAAAVAVASTAVAEHPKNAVVARRSSGRYHRGGATSISASAGGLGEGRGVGVGGGGSGGTSVSADVSSAGGAVGSDRGSSTPSTPPPLKSSSSAFVSCECCVSACSGPEGSPFDQCARAASSCRGTRHRTASPAPSGSTGSAGSAVSAVKQPRSLLGPGIEETDAVVDPFISPSTLPLPAPRTRLRQVLPPSLSTGWPDEGEGEGEEEERKASAFVDGDWGLGGGVTRQGPAAAVMVVEAEAVVSPLAPDVAAAGTAATAASKGAATFTAPTFSGYTDNAPPTLISGPGGVSADDANDADHGRTNVTSSCERDHASAGTVGELPRVGIGEEEEEGSDSSEGGDNDGDPASGVGVAQAVLDAAETLALRFSIPGLSEAAGLMTVLVERTADTRSTAYTGAGGAVVTLTTTTAAQSKLQWCKSALAMLERAGDVLGQVSWVKRSGLVLFYRVGGPAVELALRLEPIR
eukprot:jgi/Undpi1/11040/HiC_scaffold_30.g13340.m1